MGGEHGALGRGLPPGRATSPQEHRLRPAEGPGGGGAAGVPEAAGEGSAPAWRQFPELKLWDLRDLTLEDRIKLIFHCLMLYSQWFEVDQLEELFED